MSFVMLLLGVWYNQTLYWKIVSHAKRIRWCLLKSSITVARHVGLCIVVVVVVIFLLKVHGYSISFVAFLGT